MYRLILSAIALLLVSCSEPKCPSGYTKYGDFCRRCPPGQERESGQCVSVVDGGEVVSDGGRDFEVEEDPSTLDMGDAAAAAPPLDAAAGRVDVEVEHEGDAMPSSGVDSAAPSDAMVPDSAAVVEHCDPNPCQRGGSCADGPGGFRCECPAGSTGARCELEICGDTTIRSDADLQASRLCAEIRGNLQIATSGLLTIDASGLPHLTKVAGDLRIAALNGSATTPLVQSMTFGSLQVVEGMLFVGGTSPGSVQQLHFPALTTIGTVADTTLQLRVEVAPDVEVLELPVLATIHGSVSIALLQRLCTLKLGAISVVTGNVSLAVLPNLPASTFAPLRAAAQGTVDQIQVGCCAVVDNASCEGFTADNRATFCGC